MLRVRNIQHVVACANTGMVRHLLDIDPGQFIGVDEHGTTSVPGVFAAGDVTTTRDEQISIAIGDGARAALSAYEYILAHTLQHPESAC